MFKNSLQPAVQINIICEFMYSHHMYRGMYIHHVRAYDWSTYSSHQDLFGLIAQLVEHCVGSPEVRVWSSPGPLAITARIIPLKFVSIGSSNA